MVGAVANVRLGVEIVVAGSGVILRAGVGVNIELLAVPFKGSRALDSS